MDEFPGFATPLEEARFLVHKNRLHRLSFETLSAADVHAVIEDLREKLSRVRHRALRAHLMGAAHTALFLALGAAFLAIGPAALRGDLDRWVGTATVWSAASFWTFQVVVASFGAFAVDYMLRRRLKIARMWDHESQSIRDTIARAEARHPSSG
jgi:hypothetical protein